MSDDQVRFRIRVRGNCSLEELKRAAVELRNEMRRIVGRSRNDGR
jgi:hypothetical protein